MADPRARLILAADNTTDAAFNQVDQRLGQLERSAARTSQRTTQSFNSMSFSIRAVRNVLAGFGVVLTARAIGDWVEAALKANDVTREQRAVLDEAGAAVGRLNSSAQSLAVTVATQLAPAIRDAAEWWRLFLFPTDGEEAEVAIQQVEERINQLTENLFAIEDGTRRRGRGEGPEEMRREIEQLRTQLQGLYADRERLAQQEQIASILPSITPEEESALNNLIGEIAIRRQELANEAAKLAQKTDEETRRTVDEAIASFEVARLEREQQAADENTKRRELLQADLEQVISSTRTRIEAEADAYAQRQAILTQARDDDLIDQRRYHQLSEALERATAERINEIRQREAQRERQLRLQQLGSVANLFSGLAAIAAAGADQSKRAFDTYKKIATAEAIVSTYAAVAYALRNPPGPPFSFINAAAAAAFGFAQVRAIQSQSWQGNGGGAVGGGGGGGTAPSVDASAALFTAPRDVSRNEPRITVNITGLVGHVDRETAFEIAEQVRRLTTEKDY